MESMFEQYTSVTGVHLALRSSARRDIPCAACGRRDALVYAWPLGDSMGHRCAVCIVKESGGQEAA
jgi:hypothetical protein